MAAVSAAEAWLYADAVARGAASAPPRTFSLLFGAAGGSGVLLDMFAPALAVNLLVFAWCRSRVEAQRAKIAKLAKTTLTPEQRALLKRKIAERIRAQAGNGAGNGAPR